MTDELDALLERLGRQRYVFHQFQVDQHGPEVVAAVHDWSEVSDVLILFHEDAACAYRTPSGPLGVDVFAPESVYWFYTGTPVWTLSALFALPQPASPTAPSELFTPPQGFALPREDRRPVRVRMRGR